MMNKHMHTSKKVISMLLAFVLLCSVFAVGGPSVLAATEYVIDGGFESDLWNSGYWSLSADWDNTTIKWYAYEDDSYLTAVEGDYTVKYYLSGEVTSSTAFKAIQSVSLPAGTYEMTILSMGGDGGQVAPIINGSIGTYSDTTGWNDWQELTYSFTVSNASTYTIGFAVMGSSGAWGYVDGVSIQPASSSSTLTYGDVSIAPVDDLQSGFYLGADVSSIIALEDSGVTFYDWTGSYEQDIFKTLAQAGVNCIRVRVWNDPYNSSTGVGYGGGNNDVDKAIEIGKRATSYGMSVLVDFHFSDFWADPGKQYAPKDWESYSVSQKSTALYNYCYSSLKSIVDAGVDVCMVQIGNETTNGFCGESSWSNMTTLMSSGCNAVRAVDSNIDIVIHFTNPEYGNYSTYAGYLNTYGVDYDVFASSYYPYWHGSLTNLTGVLDDVADTYGKKVMVAETSWAYTYNDGDGHSNTISSSSGITETYGISEQGQADEFRAVVEAVNEASNAIGVFYWEPAWIPVNNTYGLSGSSYNTAYAANQTAWETYGSGWASSSASEYCSDAASYYGGSSWDNQAMFSFDGVPLDSLMVYNLIQGKNTQNSVSGTTTIKVTPPTNLYAYTFGYTSIKMTWDAVEGADGYEIFRCDRAGQPYYYTDEVGADETSYRNIGLSTGTTYYYKVRAFVYLEDGTKLYSDLSAYSSARPLPATPVVTATRTSATTATISWVKIYGATGYSVYRATEEDGTYTFVANLKSYDTTAYEATGLASTTTYYYKVRAYRQMGDDMMFGSYSKPAAAFGAPATPVITARSVGYTSAKVVWEPVANADGYAIYRCDVGGGAYSYVASVGADVTSYTNTGLSTGTTYYYKVRAYMNVENGKLYGNYSACATARPIPATPVVTVTADSSTTATVSWVRIYGATGYSVYRSTEKDGTYTFLAGISNGDTVTYTDKNLDEGLTYYYKVRAYRQMGSDKMFSNYSLPVCAKQD